MRTVAAVAALVVAVVGLPLAVVTVAAQPTGGQGVPSAVALAEIPPGYLPLYLDAPARHCPGLDWSVLAAVGWVETQHGTLDAPGVRSGANFAGAAGPMQFGIGGAAGNTWGGAPVRPVPPELRYGVDGNGDGLADVYDPADAVPAAAGYLCANGGGDPARLRDAIWAYNHSQAYVDQVLAKAAQYATAPALAVPASGDLVADVLASPRIRVYEGGRRDIADGVVDARVLTLLLALSQRHTLLVTSLRTGHSMCVGGGSRPGCNVSNHWHGRAADIFSIDEAPVVDRPAAVRAVVDALAGLQGPLRPTEVGSPWDNGSPGHFTDTAHHDHIHVGYGA